LCRVLELLLSLDQRRLLIANRDKTRTRLFDGDDLGTARERQKSGENYQPQGGDGLGPFRLILWLLS
jgi:hypothetical protein